MVLTQRARGKILFGFLSALLSVLLLASSGAQAATDGRQITQYDLVATVRADGVVEVELTFVFDFGNDPGHGPYLSFISRQGYDDASDRLYKYQNVQVHSPSGAPANLHTEDQHWDFLVRIGDPNIGDVSGAHTYVLTFELVGMLNDDTSTGSGMDELFWNVLGEDWEIPLSNITVQVQDDFGAGVVEADCFAGPTGSAANCSGADLSAGVATYRQDYLDPGEQLTVVAGWPAETWAGGPGEELAPILEDRGSRPTQDVFDTFSPESTGVLEGVISGVLAVGGALILIPKLRRNRRDEVYLGVAHGQFPATGERVQIGKRNAKAPVAVQFTPPVGLSPAEAGVVIDEKAEQREFTATLIDLAVRGYLQIQEVPPKKPGGKIKDWLLVPTGADLTGLGPHEVHLLQKLLPSGPVHLSSLRKASDLAEIYAKHNSLVNELMVSRGLFQKNPAKVREAWKNWGTFLLLSLFLVIGGAIAWIAVGGSKVILALPVVITLLAIATLWGAKHAPVRTAGGSALLAQTAGFEMYLRTAEGEQLRYEEMQSVFSRYLPFAIAFGVTDHWNKILYKLMDAGLAPHQSWYAGSDPARTVLDAAFISSMIRSVNQTTKNSLKVQAAENAATSGSSGGSGFSGGGSSGGGGGGGGGGGW